MGKTIALCNLGGGSIAPFVPEFLKKVPKSNKTIIVEFPCLGAPQMSYVLQQLKIMKETTIDQLLLDHDRSQKKQSKRIFIERMASI